MDNNIKLTCIKCRQLKPVHQLNENKTCEDCVQQAVDKLNFTNH